MRHLFAALLLALTVVSATAADLPSAAPLFALTAIGADDRPLALASLRGKPMMVNFWARWCVPCRKEIPDLADLYASHRGEGLVVIGIAVEDVGNRDGVREFAKAYEMSYPLVIGGMQQSIDLMQALGNSRSGLPFTVLIDRDGRIRSSKLGAMSRSELEVAVKPIL